MPNNYTFYDYVERIKHNVENIRTNINVAKSRLSNEEYKEIDFNLYCIKMEIFEIDLAYLKSSYLGDPIESE